VSPWNRGKGRLEVENSLGGSGERRAERLFPGWCLEIERGSGEEERRAELAAPNELAGIGQLGRRERGQRGSGGGSGTAAKAEETGGAGRERAERRHCGSRRRRLWLLAVESARVFLEEGGGRLFRLGSG
jgi:hypothetical protein